VFAVVKPPVNAVDDSGTPANPSGALTGNGTFNDAPVHGVSVELHDHDTVHVMSSPESTDGDNAATDTANVGGPACAGTAPTNANMPARIRASAPEATDLTNDVLRTRFDAMPASPIPISGPALDALNGHRP